MPVDVQTVLAMAVLPLVPAVGLAWLLGWLVPAETSKRYVLGLAVAAGFFAGYVVLPDPALVPVKYWHWLPYLAAASVLAAMTQAPGVSWPVRLVASGLVALAAAWLLVPDWEDLKPPRHITIGLLAAYFALLTAAMTPLPNRLVGVQFLGLLAAAAAVLALLIALGFSLRFGQLAAVAAAAFAGVWLAALAMSNWPRGDERHPAWLPTAIRGLVPVFALLIGGLAFVGTIDPDPQMPVMLVAPLAPLALWLFAAGPLARLQGLSAILAQCAAVAIPLLIAVGVVALGSGH